MFGTRFHLFTIFGFPVRIDLSWFIIVLLVTWSLAEGWFGNPQLYPGLIDRPGLRWAMGIAGAIGLFASIVVHELGHAKVAQRFGMTMSGITLFIFGGVAEMTDEPPSAKAEFWMAIAGPIVSVAVGALCLLGWLAGVGWLGWPTAVTAVLAWLGTINWVLVVFNIIPAFPLDGGRVLRSIIWHFTDSIHKATRITSSIGSGFGIALMVLAAVELVFGGLAYLFSALWLFLIGMFLRGAAQMSYQRLVVRRTLEGEPVDRFMKADPITIEAGTSIEDAVEHYIYRHHFKMFPVLEDGRLIGCLTLERVRELPRERWAETTAGELAEPVGETNTIESGRDVVDALSRMQQSERSRLMVAEGDRLVGVVALKDLMDFLSLKIELEERPRRRAA